jgi:two-component system catabolic regulation response regulator CreB/two-component system response regulator ChvI
VAINAVKVMLVDDSADTLAALSRNLRRQGFNVDAFNGSNYALSEFKPNHYDIIILDLSMPGINGLELAEAILAKDSDANVSILSAFDITEVETKRRFKGVKSIRFLKKPISASSLVNHINETVRH